MKAGFVKIYIKNTDLDLSEFVERFTYTDSIDEDNVMEVDFKTSDNFDTINLKHLISGAIMQAQWGLMGEEGSPVHEARIMDIDVAYTKRVKLTVTAIDTGNVLKKESSLKVWKNTTLYKIIHQIASKYNLNTDISCPDKSITNFPQAGKTDFEFLDYLASSQNGGDYIFYITSNTLFFTKRGVGKKARYLFTYKKGDFVSFHASLKESITKTVAKRSNSVVVHEDGKISKVENNDKDLVLDKYFTQALNLKPLVAPTLPKVPLTPSTVPFSNPIDIENLSNFEKSETVSNSIVFPPMDIGEQKNITDHLNKKYKLHIFEGRLKLVGNPFIVSNEIVTINNLAKLHIGNWLIKKVTHKIDAKSPYYTTCDLLKDGTKKTTGGDAQTNVNTSIGEEITTKTSEIPLVYSKDYIPDDPSRVPTLNETFDELNNGI